MQRKAFSSLVSRIWIRWEYKAGLCAANPAELCRGQMDSRYSPHYQPLCLTSIMLPAAAAEQTPALTGSACSSGIYKLILSLTSYPLSKYRDNTS